MIVPVLAAFLAIFALTMYVLLDGFDLGTGVLLLTSRDEAERDAIIESIAPTWDGNETWLILLGITLFAAFPLAYSTLLPALYLPIIVMLLSLGFRGVSFEFRYQTVDYRNRWDIAFSCGSLIASICQGLVLGVVLGGVGSPQQVPLTMLSGFGILIAIGTVVSYALLGAAWVHWRVPGKTGNAAGKQVRLLLGLLAAIVLLAGAWLMTGDTPAFEAWRGREIWIAPFAVADIALWLACWFLVDRSPARTRLCAMALIALFLVGIVATVWPYIIPYTTTIWEASAPAKSQILLLGGVALILPVVLANSAFVYWTFRKKVPSAAGVA